MPRTNKVAEPSAELPEEQPVEGELELTVNCPVKGCRRELVLQPHPTRRTRLVAYCQCQGAAGSRGRAVYETDAPPVEKAGDEEGE